MSAQAETSGNAAMLMRAATARRVRDSSYGLGKVWASVSRWMGARSRALLARRASRRLSVSETVSLGEKRFVSILCVDGEQFLVGGSSSNVVLLAKLDKGEPVRSERREAGECFSELLTRAGGDGIENVTPSAARGGGL